MYPTGGAMAAIISSVGVAIFGAASSYFAYQKKKLCFKVQGGEFGTFLQWKNQNPYKHYLGFDLYKLLTFLSSSDCKN